MWRWHEAGRHGRSFPYSRSQSGLRAGDDVRLDDGATAMRPGARHGVSPPQAPSQGCEQETKSAEMTGRRQEAGCQARSFPSSRSQSGMQSGEDVRRDDGATARGRAPGTEFSPPLALSQGCEQETTMVVPQRYIGDKQTAGVL